MGRQGLMPFWNMDGARWAVGGRGVARLANDWRRVGQMEPEMSLMDSGEGRVRARSERRGALHHRPSDKSHWQKFPQEKISGPSGKSHWQKFPLAKISGPATATGKNREKISGRPRFAAAP